VSSLAETSGLASSTGKSSAFSALVDRVDDPVDSRVITDLLVSRINHDNLIVLHSSVLVNPIRVQDSQVGVTASGLLLSDVL
jgi:hypothetical protein